MIRWPWRRPRRDLDADIKRLGIAVTSLRRERDELLEVCARLRERLARYQRKRGPGGRFVA